MKCLFLGGYADGQVIDVDRPDAPYNVPEIQRVSRSWTSKAPETVKVQTYLPMPFYADDFKPILYAEQDMSAADVLRQLIMRYQK